MQLESWEKKRWRQRAIIDAWNRPDVQRARLRRRPLFSKGDIMLSLGAGMRGPDSEIEQLLGPLLVSRSYYVCIESSRAVWSANQYTPGSQCILGEFGDVVERWLGTNPGCASIISGDFMSALSTVRESWGRAVQAAPPGCLLVGNFVDGLRGHRTPRDEAIQSLAPARFLDEFEYTNGPTKMRTVVGLK